jgi:CubicO group peptidase (beta-lactamase class C family)
MKKIDQFMDGAVSDWVFPGASLIINLEGNTLKRACYGHCTLFPEDEETNLGTIFDIASLTKPIATTTAVMILQREEKLGIEEKVSSYIPEFDIGQKKEIRIWHLLTHSSGLPAWIPFYQMIELPLKLDRPSASWISVRDSMITKFLGLISKIPLMSKPGEKSCYSDLGFMVLHWIVEAASGMEFDRFCSKRIFLPLQMEDTFFVRLNSRNRRKKGHFASTEICPIRRRLLRGEVHDLNCYILGGYSGHSGLFSKVDDLDKFVEFILKSYHGINSGVERLIIPPEIMKPFLQRRSSVQGSTWACGWDTPSKIYSSSGRHFSSHSIGHLGYTGCSIWIDMERWIYVILLTNRCHPTSRNEKIKKFRPLFHDLVMEELGLAKR